MNLTSEEELKRIEEKIKRLEQEIEYWESNPITRTKYEHYNQRILQEKQEELRNTQQEKEAINVIVERGAMSLKSPPVDKPINNDKEEIMNEETKKSIEPFSANQLRFMDNLVASAKEQGIQEGKIQAIKEQMDFLLWLDKYINEEIGNTNFCYPIPLKERIEKLNNENRN